MILDDISKMEIDEKIKKDLIMRVKAQADAVRKGLEQAIKMADQKMLQKAQMIALKISQDIDMAEKHAIKAAKGGKKEVEEAFKKGGKKVKKGIDKVGKTIKGLF